MHHSTTLRTCTSTVPGNLLHVPVSTCKNTLRLPEPTIHNLSPCSRSHYSSTLRSICPSTPRTSSNASCRRLWSTARSTAASTRFTGSATGQFQFLQTTHLCIARHSQLFVLISFTFQLCVRGGGNNNNKKKTLKQCPKPKPTALHTNNRPHTLTSNAPALTVFL